MNFHPRYGPDTGVVATFEIDLGSTGPTRIHGRRVGFATSRLADHNHTGRRAADGVRCSACRWFEVHLFRTTDGEYVVHTAGMSALPDEVPLIKVTRTRSPYEVVEILTIRRGGNTTIPAPSARVLAQAAEFDNGIFDAYKIGPLTAHTTSAPTV